MRRMIAVMLLAAGLVLGCSDDDGPGGDGPRGEGQPPVDSFVPTEQGTQLPWPDSQVIKDSSSWKCTPGQTNMCDGYKTQYCDNGTCTPCPANKVDCDRQGDCECFGACDGTKCVKGGG